ncbi:hypothetical protein QE152_g4425 [Popillia japonica]|uniref:Uncharacterized protein n=1 Tax=Popillia japonica TaxID=7064 RepID=A0AAW1N0T3_POPJA
MILKQNNNYYYQVQGQLEVTNREYCDFVVWSPKGMLVERISRNKTFWAEKMAQHLKKIYLECMLPEIVDPRKKRTLPIRSPPHR